MTKPICRLENFSFKYMQSNRRVFQSLDLTINENDVVLVIGENGSGKSTLLSLLGNSWPKKRMGKQKGEIWIADRTTIVYQRPQSQILTFRIDEELVSALSYRGVNRTTRRKYLTELISRFEISDPMDKDPRQLSAGIQQKIVVLSTYGTNSPIFLLDEPTTLLDEENRVLILDLLKELHSLGVTLVITTHNPQHYTDFVNKFYRIERKKLIPITKATFRKHQYPTSISIPQMPTKYYHCNIQVGYEKILFTMKTSIPYTGITLVIGRNGIGKTTLLLTLASIISPIESEFEFETKSLFVPVDPSAFFWRPTVQDELPPEMDTPTGFEDLKMQSPFILSVGQKKLLAISVSLFDSDIVLIDEPTQSLDRTNKRFLFRNLIKNSGSKLLILASNDTEFIQAIKPYCAKVLNLEEYNA